MNFRDYEASGAIFALLLVIAGIGGTVLLFIVIEGIRL
jgi:hypothetical protein